MELPKSKKSDEDRERVETAIASVGREVRYNVLDYSVEHLVNKIADDEYYVPEYQRKFTWDASKKSRFLESVLVGLPIPFVFFWQDDDGRFEIVDGSQRLRTLHQFVLERLKLGKGLELIPEAKGFAFHDLPESRRRKFLAQSIRGILLENATSVATRTEMFNRINTAGSKANDAEVRRGSLPGPLTDLVIELAESPDFIAMTPISPKRVNEREREELVVRFLAFTSRHDPNPDGPMFEGYRDRPRNFIFDFVKSANENMTDNDLQKLRDDFARMLDFVRRTFPDGFQKPDRSALIPRARYEALSVGSHLALEREPQLFNDPPNVTDWMDGRDFVRATTSDGANTRSRLEGRVSFVRDNLLEAAQ